MFTFSQTGIITVGSYEHRALYSRLDVESIVSGGLVVLHSPADTLPALARTLQGSETVTVISEAGATCLLGST